MKAISGHRPQEGVLLAKKTGPAALRQALETKPVRPLTALARDVPSTNGEPAGSITCKPHEVDAIATRAWSTVYLGNNNNYNQLIHEYFRTYAAHIYNAPPFDIDDLTGTQLGQACLEAKHSTAGPDHFTPEHFSLLPPLAYDWLAYLLDRIEHGAPWPKDLLHAKASYLSKDPKQTHDPLFLPLPADLTRALPTLGVRPPCLP